LIQKTGNNDNPAETDPERVLVKNIIKKAFRDFDHHKQNDKLTRLIAVYETACRNEHGS